MNTYYEFFAGGGMARAGLGTGWECLFANDFDPKKASTYIANWGSQHLHVGDVAKLNTSNLPGHADLVWASFPCQDLSLAGAGAGLRGDRSGTFWPFWKLIKSLCIEGRAPKLIVLENVCGALTSHDGKDFSAISAALASEGYQFGTVIINASLFLPQSRPRLFIVGVHSSVPIPSNLLSNNSSKHWHPTALIDAYEKLPKHAKHAWKWWHIPMPPVRTSIFADLVESAPEGVSWHTAAETKKILAMMSERNLAKVEAAHKSGQRMVGTIYKRTRPNGPNGEKVQRAEIRFDDIAGCLRTPTGGSSRQTIMVIEGKKILSRLLSPREAARLMGLPEAYLLPKNYNEAYHLAGDGVAVPVVRFLAKNILEPLLKTNSAISTKAA